MNISDIISYWDNNLVEQHVGSELSVIIEYFNKHNINNIKYLDIGANTGKYYDVLSRFVKIDYCIMVEASKSLYDYLLIKFKESNTDIHNLILSDINDNVSFTDIDFSQITDIHSTNLGLSKVYKSNNNTRQQVSAESFFEEHILNKNIFTLDLIKIDTENRDYEILKSLTPVVKKLHNKPIICFEHNYHNSMTLNEAQNILNNFTDINNYMPINIGDIIWSAVFLYPNKSQ